MDAAVGVGFHGLAFHDPFEGGFAVDDVVIRFQRDVADGDVVVVDDGGFVVDGLVGFGVAGFGELHLLHAVGAVLEIMQRGGGDLVHLCSGITGHGFVVEVPVGEVATGFGEGGEIGEALHGGDTREFLAEVVGVAAAVVGGVQQAVDVVEEGFFGDRVALALRGIGRLEMRQARVADAVAPGVAVGFLRPGRGKQVASVLVVVGFLLEVEGGSIGFHPLNNRNGK